MNETFTVISGLGMVLAEIVGIVVAGYIVDKFRYHFEWIRRIAP